MVSPAPAPAPPPAPPPPSIGSEDRSWLWTLFVCGAGSHSAAALAAMHRLCAQAVPDRVELRIQDIHHDPAAAMRAGVLAVPCLVCGPPPRAERTDPENGDCEALQRRVDQLEAALAAITNGGSDGLLVGSNGPAGGGGRFFLPEGAHEPYRDLVEQMAAGVGTLSGDGRLLFANARLAALLDRPPATLLGRRLAELVPASQRGCLERLRRVSPGRSERAELELQPEQGDPVRVLAVVSGLTGGGIARHCLTLTDLSDLRPPGAMGAGDEPRHRLLAESVSAFLVETDGQRRIDWVSPSVEAVLGWLPRDLLGTALGDLLHPQSNPEVLAATWPRQPLLRLRGKDGGERWMRLLAWPHRGEGHTPCRWILAFQDAGERVAEQQARDLDQARLAAVLMSARGAQIVLRTLRRPDGAVAGFTCAAANDDACRQYGLSRHELVGRPLEQVLTAPAAGALLALCRRAMESESSRAPGELVSPCGADGGDGHGGVRVVRVGEVLSCCWDGREAGLPRPRIQPPSGLVSRPELLEEMARRHPPEQRQTRPLAFALCHLRNLRRIHEEHGAGSADRVMQTVASRFRRFLRQDAFLARVRVDQLLVVFDGMDNHAQAAIRAESMLVAMGLPLPIPDPSIGISASVEVTLQRPGDRVEDLIRRVLDGELPLVEARRS